MEACELIQCETEAQSEKSIETKICFNEEIKINKGEKEYRILFGKNESNNTLIIKVIPEYSQNIFYYQSVFSILEIQKISKIMSIFKTLTNIIIFLKNLQFEIVDTNDDSKIKLVAYKFSKLIEIDLEKYPKFTKDIDNAINHLLKEIKLIKKDKLLNLNENNLNKRLFLMLFLYFEI